MKNYHLRRKFTTYKFFVEGQVGKVFLRPQKLWKNNFWLWHIGFAVGKSTRQVNDWYYRKQNKRARSVRKKLTGKSGTKFLIEGMRGVMTLRWNLHPGDCLYLDNTSSEPDKQFRAVGWLLRKHPEWTVDKEAKIYFWHRPPYSNDEIWNDYIAIPKTPANPLQSMANNQYFDAFSLLPRDQCKAKSKDQN
tara:strand:+ start:563 stop:1135 length:573 start_codon:yes stop_codon:yes gene_type:complete